MFPSSISFTSPIKSEVTAKYQPGHADADEVVLLLLFVLALARQQTAATATQMVAARTAIVMPNKTALETLRRASH